MGSKISSSRIAMPPPLPGSIPAYFIGCPSIYPQLSHDLERLPAKDGLSLYFFDFYVCQVCHFDLRMSKVYPTESIEKVHPWLATLINRAKVAGKWKDIL